MSGIGFCPWHKSDELASFENYTRRYHIKPTLPCPFQ